MFKHIKYTVMDGILDVFFFNTFSYENAYTMNEFAIRQLPAYILNVHFYFYFDLSKISLRIFPYVLQKH